MSQYKDTSQATNTLKTPKNGQIDTSAKVTFSDVIKSILLVVLIIALLLFITTLQQAHPKNSLLLVAGMGQNITLSKTNSDTPNRYPLAFFMPKFCLFSQNSKKHGINTPSPLHRAITTFLLAFTAICYGRVTLKNKPARRIFKAVTVLTESEPYHPLQVVISLTQNNTGGYLA